MQFLVTRVSTQGFVTIRINAVLKDMKKYGYDNVPYTISKPSEFPLSNFQDSLEHRSPQADQASAPQLTSTQEMVEPDADIVQPNEQLVEERIEDLEEVASID